MKKIAVSIWSTKGEVCGGGVTYRRGTTAAEASQLTPTRAVRVALRRILARFGHQKKLYSLDFTASLLAAFLSLEE